MEQGIDLLTSHREIRAKHDLSMDQVCELRLCLQGILLRRLASRVARLGDALELLQELDVLRVDLDRTLKKVVIVE